MRKIFLTFIMLWLTASISLLQGQEIITAAASGNLEKVKELLERDQSQVNTKDSLGRTPLHWAARGVHFEVLKYLVEKGADVNAKDNNNIPPIASVVSRNHLEGTRFLINKGASIIEINSRKETILHDAAARGYSEIVKLLLEKNAPMEARNSYNRTPLIVAAREMGGIKVVKLLVENGADINAKDNSLDSPLTLAAWRGFEDIVNYLIDKNADIQVTGNKAKALFEDALNKRLIRLYETIVKRGGDPEKLIDKGNTALHWGAKGGSMQIVSDLLKRKFNVNAVDAYGMTPLHYAARYSRIEVMKTLIENGAELNAKSMVEETPYNLAVKAGRKESADFLQAAGADLEKPVYTKLKGKYFGMKEPGNVPEAFAVGIASNMVGGHSNITFSPNGDEAFWTEWNEMETGYTDGCKIYYSKIENGYWTVPEIFKTKGDTPIYSGDGSGLFYLEVAPKKEIVFIKKNSNSYLSPIPVEFDLEQSGLYWQFSLDKNKNIYYGADGGLYRALLKDGKYLAPEKLSEVFHPDYKGMHPFVSPQGDYLLFSADGECGRYDIFIGYKKSDGTWTKPVNLGNKINSPGSEFFPIVSGDGKFLFFGSGQNGFGGKCWVSTRFIEELRPKE